MNSDVRINEIQDEFLRIARSVNSLAHLTGTSEGDIDGNAITALLELIHTDIQRTAKDVFSGLERLDNICDSEKLNELSKKQAV